MWGAGRLVCRRVAASLLPACGGLVGRRVADLLMIPSSRLVVVGEYEAGYAGPEATPVGYPLEPLTLTNNLIRITNPLGNVVLAEAEVEADLPEPAQS